MNIRITRPTLTKEEREQRMEQIKRAIVEVYRDKGKNDEK